MKKKTFFIAFVFLALGYFGLRHERISPRSTLESDTQEAVCESGKGFLARNVFKEKKVAQSNLGISYADYHQPTETAVDMPLGQMVLTTFSQRGIPIQGMRIRKVVKKDGSEQILENTYRAIPEIAISPSTVSENLLIYVGRHQSFGELAFAQENQIIRLSDGLRLKKLHPRKERKPASLHQKGFGD